MGGSEAPAKGWRVRREELGEMLGRAVQCRKRVVLAKAKGHSS